jgi:hypothetical protein
MSTPMNRRAALGALASVPALAILPPAGSALTLASAACPAHPDAALLAMQPAIDAADRELQAAFDAINPAEDAYFDKAPDRPEQPRPKFALEIRTKLNLWNRLSQFSLSKSVHVNTSATVHKSFET